MTSNNSEKRLFCYYPETKFPSISITGNNCALNCKHCNQHYLQHMIPATTPDELYAVSKHINSQGAVGFLLSGGFTKDSKLPLDNYYGTINKDMKAEITTELSTPREYSANVIIVDRVIDAASGTFRVRLELPNKDHLLPAGLKCKVIFSNR